MCLRFTLFTHDILIPCPGKPVIDPPAPVKVGKEGDKVTLMCVAYGVPTPNFTWQPSGGEQVDI